MAIKKIGTLDSHGAPVLLNRIITNSVVTTVGDSVKVASGFMALGTAGALVFGHVDGISADEGLGKTDNGASGDFTGTFTAASDNQTVAKVRAIADVSKMSLYDAEVDAALGTTTGSDLAQYTMDLVDEDTLDESTAVATTGQYMSQGVNPLDTDQVIVNIFESQVFGV